MGEPLDRGGVKIVLTEAGERADLRGAHVIEASPSLGAAGLIAINYLVETLKPVKIAEVKSLHFPHVSIVDEGLASHPSINLYLHRDGDLKLVFISRNFPIESEEGGYLIASKLHRFLVERGAVNYYLLSSSRITGERAVFVASSNPDDVRRFLDSGARILSNLDNIPADKLSSYLLMLYMRDTGHACILVSEVVTYFPDPISARMLITVLAKGLGFKVDLERLDEEIEKHRRILEEVQKGYERMLQKQRERPSREPFYIG